MMKYLILIEYLVLILLSLHLSVLGMKTDDVRKNLPIQPLSHFFTKENYKNNKIKNEARASINLFQSIYLF
jgi:hypothetical protein